MGCGIQSPNYIATGHVMPGAVANNPYSPGYGPQSPLYSSNAIASFQSPH